MGHTCVITDGLEPVCGLSDGARNWGSSNSSKRNDGHHDSCPSPSIVHVTHHHNGHRKQGNICSGTEPVDDRNGDEGSFRRSEWPNVRHDRTQQGQRGGHG